MRFSPPLLLLALLGCGGESTVTGGFLQFSSKLEYLGVSGEYTQDFKPLDEPDIASLSRGCARLDLAASEVNVEAYEGATDTQFSLEATLVDGTTEVPFFAWTGLLEDGGRRLSFESADVGFSPGVQGTLNQILTRADPDFQVRFRFTADGAATKSTLRVVQHYQIETDPAACQ